MRDVAAIATTDAALKRILSRTRTIALIGASPKSWRDSFMVMAYLQQQGFRVVPINPFVASATILGEPVHASLATIAEPVDMVDVFRRSDAIGDIIDATIIERDRLQIQSVWLQLGVCDCTAAQRAISAGLDVVMDRCIKIEHRRLGYPGQSGPQTRA